VVRCHGRQLSAGLRRRPARDGSMEGGWRDGIDGCGAVVHAYTCADGVSVSVALVGAGRSIRPGAPRELVRWWAARRYHSHTPGGTTPCMPVHFSAPRELMQGWAVRPYRSHTPGRTTPCMHVHFSAPRELMRGRPPGGTPPTLQAVLPHV